MKTSKKITSPIIVITMGLLFAFTTLNCASAPETKEEDNKKQEKVKLKKKEEISETKIALIPFDYTFKINPKDATESLNKLAAAMLENDKFKPFSLKEWMEEQFKSSKAKNIYTILDRATATNIAADFICHGKLFKCGSKYGLMLAAYPLKMGIEPSYYYRSFLNFNTIDELCEGIVAEMESRCNTYSRFTLNKNVFLKKFNIKFYTYTKLKTGEHSLIKLPYLDINGVSYKSNDHIFDEILLYNLHKTRLISVWNSNMEKYIRYRPIVPSDMDYVIYTDLDISKDISMITIRVKKKNKTIFKYQYPFSKIDLDYIFQTMQENAKIILLSLLEDEEHKKVGSVELNTIEDYQSVFCDNFYIGHGNQKSLIFPSGSAGVTIGLKQYKIFISPFTLNNRIFDIDKSYLLNLEK